MIRIAICDDEQQQRDYMTLLVNQWAKAGNLSLQLDQYESAEQFKMMREEDTPHDILLLDIQMGGQDGVSLARELRAANESLVIIFITGVADFIQEGYDVSALHYLMKPVDENKLLAVLDRAVQHVAKAEPQLLLPVEGETVRVPVGDVMYVESFAHYLEVGLAAALPQAPSGIITVKMPAYKLEEQLGPNFVRCHRSYLVGMKHVSKITKTDVVLDSGKAIPLSRRMQAAVNEAFMAYISPAAGNR